MGWVQSCCGVSNFRRSRSSCLLICCSPRVAGFLAGETMPDPMTTGHSDAATLLQVLYAEKSKQGDTELAGHVPDIAE